MLLSSEKTNNIEDIITMEIINNIFFGILVLINNVFVVNFKKVDTISGNITTGDNKKMLQ